MVKSDERYSGACQEAISVIVEVRCCGGVQRRGQAPGRAESTGETHGTTTGSGPARVARKH